MTLKGREGDRGRPTSLTLAGMEYKPPMLVFGMNTKNDREDLDVDFLLLPRIDALQQVLSRHFYRLNHSERKI